MKNKPLLKRFLEFVLPSVEGMLMFSLCTIVDGIFVGRGVGFDGLSSVNISMPYITLLFALAMLLSMGGLTATTFYLGKGEEVIANKRFSMTIGVALFFGLSIAIFSYLNLDSLVKILDSGGLVSEYVKDYVGVIAIFSPFFILTYAFELMIKADGHPRFGFRLMALSALSNVVMDYIFVILWEKGVRGAAIATGISQAIPTVIYFIHFLSSNSKLKFVIPEIRIKSIAKTWVFGIPMALTELSVGFITFIYNHNLMKHGGTKELAAFSIAMYLLSLTTNAMVAVCQGANPLISYSFGKNDQQRLKVLKRMLFACIAVLSIFAFGLVQILSENIVLAFIDDYTKDFLDYASSAIRAFSTAFLVLGFNVAIGGYSTAIQKPAIELSTTIMRGYIASYISIVVVAGWDVAKLRYALFFSEAFTLLFMLALIFGVRALRKSKTQIF